MQKNNQIYKISKALGLDESMLRNMMSLKVDEDNINEYGRLDNLKNTINMSKATEYFENVEGMKIPLPKVNIKIDTLLRKFIISGGCDITEV